MLPPDPAVSADPDVVLDLIDGLLLAGGADVDPALRRRPDGGDDTRCPSATSSRSR
jgi:gamma-glutamyl-gamma-aminobutyrate hydrolase PuuD